jgi:hypothetical protein
MVLVGNKKDLTDKMIIPEDEGKQLALSFKMEYHETSAFLNEGLDEMMDDIME